MTPEQKLATRFVRQHDLTPPVDIEAVVAEYATVERVAWPFDCDALTADLIGEKTGRPTIFLRSPGRHWRDRFTIGHELGHIIIPWHCDLVACHPGADVQNYSGGLQEREASSFASCILLPDRYLRPIVEASHEVKDWLDAVAVGDISAAAGLIGLASRVLAPGIAFVIRDNRRRPILSAGTLLPVPYDARTYARDFAAVAVDSGTVSHQAHYIDWYKFVQLEHPEEVVDSRDSRQILRDAIAAVTDDSQEARRLTQSVNGVVGANLARDIRTSPVTAYNTLRYIFQNRPHLAEVVEQPDFDRFLKRKIADLREQ
jgi:hypothetical protein